MDAQTHAAALKSANTFYKAVESLKALGAEGVPILAHALNDDTLYPNLSSDQPYDDQRKAIVKALEDLGALSQPAIPDLVQALQDERMRPYVGMRNAAALALVRIAPSDERVITALSDALVTSIGAHAALALGEAGPNAKSALPALRSCLKSQALARRRSNKRVMAM